MQIPEEQHCYGLHCSAGQENSAPFMWISNRRTSFPVENKKSINCHSRIGGTFTQLFVSLSHLYRISKSLQPVIPTHLHCCCCFYDQGQHPSTWKWLQMVFHFHANNGPVEGMCSRLRRTANHILLRQSASLFDVLAVPINCPFCQRKRP